MRTFTDIGKPCRFSFGSLQELRVYLPEDILTLPSMLCCPLVAEPVLKNGKRPFVFRHDLDTAALNEDTVVNDQHGDSYEQTIVASFKHDRMELRKLARNVRNARVHVIATDYNGLRLWLPWMRVKPSMDKNNNRSGFNGWKFSFSSRSKYPAAQVEDVPLTGSIDCSPFYVNIDPNKFIPVTGQSGNAVSDDFGNVISDDFDQILTDDSL